MKDKAKQRRYLKEMRNSIPCEERQLKSDKICRKLFASAEYVAADTVMIYMSFGSEVQTEAVFERVLKDKKRLAVPLCNPSDRLMDGYYINGKDCLERGSYGIYEPSRRLIESGELVKADKSDIDLIVVPGLGFDKGGYRIGYGAGYYDRYLEGFCGKTIGFCFKECVIENVFRDEHDKKIDRIITD